MSGIREDRFLRTSGTARNETAAGEASYRSAGHRFPQQPVGELNRSDRGTALAVVSQLVLCGNGK